MIHHMNEKKMMLTTGFYVTAELKIKDPNKILETRNALSALCKITLEQESGCTLFQLHQCQNDATRLLLWERFDSEDAYNTHFQQSHTKAYLAQDLTEVMQHFISDIVL